MSKIYCPSCGAYVCGGPKHGLTERQLETLDFIKAHIRKNGVSPTYREIMAALGLRSTSEAHRLVHGLRDRGHIELKYYSGRSIVLVAA